MPKNVFAILLRERDRDSCAAQNAHVLQYIPLFALLFIPLTHARYRSKAHSKSKKAAHTGGFFVAIASSDKKLTLGELFCATCFAQTNFFTFNFASITSNEASF